VWITAIEDAINKTYKNIERFGDLFPHTGKDGGDYVLITNDDWTNGFWSGILWLCYEYTDDRVFAEAAERTVKSFQQRMKQNRSMEGHDMGFLFSLSAKAQWMIEKNKAAQELALAAADVLMKRWRPEMQIIQAWGPKGDLENGGRIIIDCLMNLPLLYWASEVTGDKAYYEVAVMHAEQSRRFLVRGDDSSYHTFYFNQETGEAIRGATHQGYSDSSTWTRGQAWGIYGFALSYRYTKKLEFLETSLRMACYFLEHLPEDEVAYWDFSVPTTPETKRDSSASAIAASGMLELLKWLPADHPQRKFVEEGVHRSMKGLITFYATRKQPEAQGFIKRGSYSVRGNRSPDDFVIWGDYYYLEALMKLEKGHKGFWYE